MPLALLVLATEVNVFPRYYNKIAYIILDYSLLTGNCFCLFLGYDYYNQYSGYSPEYNYSYGYPSYGAGAGAGKCIIS